MPSFNLTSERWIPMLLTNGSSEEVSLLDAIRRAPEIARISGNPLEAAVLHRLILAIAHRVCTPEDAGEWGSLWKDRSSFLSKMSDYVEAHADQFDLYSNVRPFGQHPGLPEPNRTPAEILYERAQGNNPVFLDASIVSQPKAISSALAARSLLVLHAFGGSGTGGLNPLNANKKDTMYAGPLCARMVAILEGQNLEETILLNLVEGVTAGLPAWEKPVKDLPTLSRSTGVCDLYTRTTRNVRLKPSESGDECVATTLAMGEGLASEEGSSDDPLIPVYFAKDKKFKALRVDPTKALWRSSHVLLAAEGSKETRPLPPIAMVRKQINRGLLGEELQIRLRALGVAANAQGPVTEMWQDETIPFSLSLFKDGTRYAAVARAIEEANKNADVLRKQLYGFASRYIANGGGSPDPKDVAKLIDEMSPDLNGYWMEIAPQGERLAIESVDTDTWSHLLSSAKHKAYEKAIDRLAPDARRMRAQFAKVDSSTTTSSRKAGVKNA